MHYPIKTRKLILATIVAAALWGQAYAVPQKPSSFTAGSPITIKKLMRDGTSLAPLSSAVYSIMSFPERQSELSNKKMIIRLTKGSLRITGGSFNQQVPIIVNTPSAKLSFINADVTISVDNKGVTKASLNYGKSLTMESGGKKKTITKTGYQLVSVSKNQPPKMVKLVNQRLLANAGTSGSNTDEDKAASDKDQTDNGGGDNGGGDNGGGDNGGGDNGGGDNGGGDNGGDGGNGVVVDLPGLNGTTDGGFAGDNLVETTASVKNGTNHDIGQEDGDRQAAHQVIVCCDSPITTMDETTVRTLGLSTNRLYTSDDHFTQNLNKKLIGNDNDTNPRTLIRSSNSGQAYYGFVTDSSTKEPVFVVELLKLENPFNPNDESIGIFTPNGFGEQRFVQSAAVMLDNLKDKESFLKDDQVVNVPSKLTVGDLNEDGSPRIVDPETLEPSTIEEGGVIANLAIRGTGVQFALKADYKLLTTGFYEEKPIELVKRKLENFIILEVDSLDKDATNERYIFAAGDVVANEQKTNKEFSDVSIDQFFLSAGLNNYAQKDDPNKTKTSDIRAFARDQTAVGNNLDSQSFVDSGLLVINHKPDSGSNKDSRVLHTDFSLVGLKENQTSTISTTLGKVYYSEFRSNSDGSPEKSPDNANDVIFSANTLGSTQASDTLISFNTDIVNTSAGGGLEGKGSGPGYADYFVLENFDPDKTDSGGTEHAIGKDTSEDLDYAFLRLASIQSNESDSQLTRNPITATGGYTAGLVSREAGNNSVKIDYLLSGIDSKLSNNRPHENFILNNDTGTSSVNVGMKFFNGFSLNLGGGDDNSAFVDDKRFAATNGSTTLISSGLVESGIDSQIKVDVPEYMQWGFFFGDVDPGNGVSHAHLASWVAGTVPDAADLPKSGSATYIGSAIGNVYNNGDLYVASGTYTNEWDFKERKGTAALNDFDGMSYSGNTVLQDNSSQFIGALTDSAQTRDVGLQGSFVENNDLVDAAEAASAGVMGQFYIQSTKDDDYRAAGTFAADVKSRKP